jgi:putative salt-induced outer membrane protein YdiY
VTVGPARVRWALAAGCLAGAPAVAAQQVLAVANGDRMHGTLKRVTDSTWVFAYRGADLKIRVDSVVWFAAPQAVGVRLADGTIGAAAIAPTPDSLALALVFADGTRRRVAPRELVAIGPPNRLALLRPVAVGWFTPLDHFWSGSASLGFSDQRGNTRAFGLGLSLELLRKTARDREDLGFGLSREQGTVQGDGLQTTVAKSYGFLQIDLHFDPRLFGTVATRQEYDRFQDLALRSTYTAGLGLELVSRSTADLRINASAGLRREDYFTAPTTTAAIAGAGATYGGHLGPIRVSARLDWSANTADFGDYRLHSGASATARVYKGLGARVEALYEYNSRPLPGIRHYDLQTRITLTYAFGH